MKVIRYNSDHQDEWNGFLAHANNSSFLFHRNFVDYHRDRFADHSLLFYENDCLVALFPAHEKDNTLCSHLGLSYGGMIHSASLTTATFLSLLEILAQHCKQHQIERIVLNDIPHIYQHTQSCLVPYVANILQAVQQVQLLSTLDLTTPVALNSNRRRMIQKGLKNGYRIQEAPTPISFWQEILIPRLQQRYQTNPVHTVEEIEKLMHAFPKSIKQMNVYNAEGVLVGGTTLFIHPHVVHLQYIAGREEDNNKGALDFLIYTLIQQYRDQVRYFDFGSSHLSPKQLNKGLLYWKESFGARSVPQYCYTFNVENLLQAQHIIDR
ncbi:GNAT family N-acetyltransferase [Myroides fluvii]|uniref:GNAT family N-acetyltransferase n=1 Tax=Myroides fluvii TaxID=2572594 RepID=UPI001E2C5ACF|nr:GNAT family N-acetyltransferase [Myroides fluvii]